jgi:hypothetical protein
MREFFDKITINLAISGIFVFTLIMFLDDKLFVSTPFLDQFYAFYLLSLMTFLLFFGLLFLRVDRIKKIATIFFIYTVLFNLFDYFLRRIEKKYFFINDYSLIYYPIIFMMSVFIIYIFYQLPISKEIQSRFLMFCRLNLAACLGVFIFFYAYNPSDINNKDEPQHLLYIVLDGMPAYLLNNYCPASPKCGLDEMINQGLAKAMPYVYTNNVYTHGYCDVLFKGDNLRSSTKNLFSELQKKNIYTKWMVFHQNAIPESHDIHDYSGFRSTMLTETFSKIFSLLGIYHHTFLAWPESRKYMGNRLKYLFQRMPNNFNETYVWEKYLIDELKHARSKFNKSFIYFHVSFNECIVQFQNEAEEESAEFHKRIALNDYAYIDKDADLVEKLKLKYFKRLAYFSERMQHLLISLKTQGLEKTKIILTADHGTILGKNRLYYGYHSNEEVTRVPFLLFNFDNVAIKNNCYDTLDIYHSLKVFFNIRDKKAEQPKEENYIFSPINKQYLNKMIYVNTEPSDKRKERFFIEYKNPHQKVIYNIYDVKNISKSNCQVSNFEEVCSPFLPVDISEYELIKNKLLQISMN